MIEYIYLAIKDYGFEQAGDDHSPVVDGHLCDHVSDFQTHSADSKSNNACNRGTDMTFPKCDNARELVGLGISHDESGQHLSAEWARPLEAASQHRTEVLMPENLENMWTKGRNYKKEVTKNSSTGFQVYGVHDLEKNSVLLSKDTGKGILAHKPISTKNKAKASEQTSSIHPPDIRALSQMETELLSWEPDITPFKSGCNYDELTDSLVVSGNKSKVKKSSSTSDLVILPDRGTAYTSKIGGPIISEFYSPNSRGHNQVATVNSASRMFLSSEAHAPKIKCRVRLVSVSFFLIITFVM